MALKIMTTGLDQYSAGGTGRVKVMVIGGPGVGKTRWSSYFPKPIYLDCEGGLASVADRKVQFASIRNSQDMLDALVFLKQESSRPVEQRNFHTVVVDTLDAFQRKVKDEWLQAHPQESSFRGFEAWGYLDTKMQMLATRLLNLDMNVIVAVHYSEKTISEGVGDAKTERQEYQLQLSGAFKDQAFNDFDLVGWMGTYFEMEDGKRTQKRGLTFKPTPDKPFLKDRLHVTPDWMEVKFNEEDYAKLFERVISRLDEMGETTEFGEIPSGTVLNGQLPGGPAPALPGGGALPPQDPRDIPVAQHDKPTLMKMARERGLEFRGNTLKTELVNMIEAHDKAKAQAPAEPAAPDTKAAEATPASAPQTPEDNGDLAKQTLAGYRSGGTSSPSAATGAGSASVEAAAEPPRVTTHEELAQHNRQVREAEQDAAARPAVLTQAADKPAKTVQTDEGTVNTATGELVPPTEPEAIENVLSALGGEVTSVTEVVEAKAEAPAADVSPFPCPNGADGCNGWCKEAGCTNPIGPTNDFVRIGYVRYREHLCDEHFTERSNKNRR